MINNWLKIALRNLARHKGYSFINLFGLAIGMTCAILIMLYVRDELSYDRYPAKARSIYRLGLEARTVNRGPVEDRPDSAALGAGLGQGLSRSPELCPL